MLSFKYNMTGDKEVVNVNEAQMRQAVFDESRTLARRMSEAYANNLKLTLLRVKAFATGDTLRSVQAQVSSGNSARGQIASRVIASRSIIFVQGGRKPGKAPLRYKGVKDGKKQFEPVPGLIRWFNALGIRRALWMAIARAIGRRGIKGREVQKRALNASITAFKDAFDVFGRNVTRRMFKPTPGQ